MLTMTAFCLFLENKEQFVMINGTPIQALAVKDGGHYWNMAGGQEYLSMFFLDRLIAAI